MYSRIRIQRLAVIGTKFITSAQIIVSFHPHFHVKFQDSNPPEKDANKEVKEDHKEGKCECPDCRERCYQWWRWAYKEYGDAA